MSEIENIELDLLLEGVYRRYGWDFRDYAKSSLRRRVRNSLDEEKVRTPSELLTRVLRDTDAMERLLLHLSVNVTTMFRDPPMWKAFREKVVPHLFSAPFVRIWSAGCASGEEIYSLAILLHEERLLERARIYATDMNMAAVERAKSGIFALDQMKEYTANYIAAGGKAAFSDYYTAQYDNAIFRSFLRKNIVFAQHNLAVDTSFNEFNVVFCRNVLIYFDEPLQQRVHQLLHASLRRFGVLVIGRRESLSHTPREGELEAIDEREKIYRRTS